MAFLEEVSQEIYNAYFVDLFVRVSNQLAQVMYGALQYTVYRQVRSCLLITPFQSHNMLAFHNS
jgi:N-terminal acetyltransferase B complex catalytic subunit